MSASAGEGAAVTAAWDFSGPLDSSRAEDLESLRADLAAADYSSEGVEGIVGAPAFEALHAEQLAPGRLLLADFWAQEDRAAQVAGAEEDSLASASGAGERAEAQRRACAVMAGWWVFATPQPAERLAAAFPRTGLEGLARLGFLALEDAEAPAGASLRPLADLRPHEGDDIGLIWVASDLGSHYAEKALDSEYVLGVGQASLTLARSIVRTPARSALDLGTGCGIQVFHLLAHCDRVTATDLSERALNYTAFNLLLNADRLRLREVDGAPRVRLLRGSLLEPVEGEAFDLVVSNPPFVITPRNARTDSSRYTYRDGGLPGDRLVAELVQTLPRVLKPGGVAQLLGNWEIVGDEPWDSAPRAWEASARETASALQPSGGDADAWFIQREETDTLQYALTWLSDAVRTWDAGAQEAALAEYRDDFASRGVTRVGFGLVLLRRPRGPEDAWRTGSVFEEITHPIEQPVGPSLAAALERRAQTARAAAAGKAGELFAVVAEDVTEERHQRPGAEHPGVILLRQGAGLRRTCLLSSELAGFVSAADGELSVAQIAGALEAILEEEGLAERLVPEVLQLVDEGFLVLPAVEG
ncbi:methyltransferase [Arthrobacter sp. UM1]|uniref:DUF7059 domain-containing protein n=1 Tax=Arthrobacter sp. UM1 TaxID=2766776 RepID=UPI001CF6332D|nr:methyltransferase [Arthrobacter sp. UM1]MCB4208976.1 methyltransferase [Arthrobacter sp. UM1]